MKIRFPESRLGRDASTVFDARQRGVGPRGRSFANQGLALFVVSALSACSTGLASDHDLTDATEDALELTSQASALRVSAPEYFLLTRDLRRCVSPLCGGYWVKAVNRLATRCANGTLAGRCYVAEADFTAAGGEPVIEGNGIVVRGAIQSRVYPNFGNLGLFVADGVWSPVSQNGSTGVFARIADNGIRCITEPCFSVDAELLNTNVRASLSSIDLSATGASDEQLEAASAAIAAGGLIASGSLRLYSGTAGVGIELTASQAFLPAAGERCYSSADCEVGERCNAEEVCLPPPGCRPETGCPAVCTGYCSAPPAACSTSADCATDSWCRATESGSFACVPYAREGERCNGFTLPWMYESCAPELSCDVPDFVADAPGICRAQCKSDADCGAEQYCATDGLCHADATCDVSADCLAPGNDYPRIQCVGYPVCPGFGEPQQNQCGWVCSSP